MDGDVGVPASCGLRDPPLANLDEDAPFSQWARGFLRGHGWLSDIWEEALPDDLEDEISAILLVLTFFASRRGVEMVQAEMVKEGIDKEGIDLEDVAGHVVSMLPDAMTAYTEMGLALRKADPDREVDDLQEEGAFAGTGRNDACPCGSGRKFKKCCGRASH